MTTQAMLLAISVIFVLWSTVVFVVVGLCWAAKRGDLSPVMAPARLMETAGLTVGEAGDRIEPAPQPTSI